MSEMLTAKEVQELLEVDRSTVYRMAEDQRLPAIKVGRQWRFPKERINRWLADQGHIAIPVPKPAPPPANGLADKLPLGCVQLVQDTFAEALGVMIIITDMAGTPVTRFSNPCGLFTALEDVPGLWERCSEHWRAMAATIEMTPHYERSSLGLLCARGLIRVGRSLEGMVFLGGVAPSEWPPTPAFVTNLAAELEVEPDRLARHLPNVHYLDQRQREHTLALIQRIADVVAHIANERTQLGLAPAAAAALAAVPTRGATR